MKDTVAVIATRKARGWAREGQRKDMPAAQARVLVMLGRAVYAPTVEQPADSKRSARYARRDMQPTQSAPAPAAMPVVTKSTNVGAMQSNDDEASQP